MVQARPASCPMHGMATLLSTLSKARIGILLSRWSKPDRQVVPCMEWQRCYPLCPRQGPVSYCPVGPSQIGKLSSAWNGNVAIHFVQARWTSCPRQGLVSYCPVGPGRNGRPELPNVWIRSAAVPLVLQARWTDSSVHGMTGLLSYLSTSGLQALQ